MDDSTRLRRKDTTKGPPLRILSLDGGGVRGYSMLIILQELMHRVFVELEGRAPKRHEIPKPCDHFDLIAGTGTGGLIAIMLGRLRLDLDTCKEVYVRMTRRVFISDKTILGVPLKGTMFKASKLEEAIREVAREHTIFEDEGNDSLANATPMTPASAASSIPQRSMSQSSRYSQIGMSPTSGRVSYQALRFGNPNALLYDTRENRTKTAVTAALKGTSVITLLRSYDSRKEPAPDANATIWQAGRATSATQMAFKPIQIGQSVYLDEGAGKYNPSPQILDEAVQNEWPGREVGLFVSIGTGKPPSSTGRKSHEWWEDVLGGGMSDFAEARRRLFAKIEGCEESHKFMLRDHLAARGVNPENYIRLNVEVGVGDMGMNEWDRLSEMTTSTRSYLSKKDVQALSLDAAAKLARIQLTKARQDRAEARRNAPGDGQQQNPNNFQQNPWDRPQPAAPPPSVPAAVELPGDDAFPQRLQNEHRSNSGDQKYPMDPDSYYVHRPSIADQKYTVAGDGYDQPAPFSPQHRPMHSYSTYNSQGPGRASLDYNNSVRFSNDTFSNSSPRQSQDFYPQSPPPVPPKTPVNAPSLPYPDQRPASLSSPDHQRNPSAQSFDSGPRTFMNMGEIGKRLPYPEAGPPPSVNMANKPALPQ